MKGHPINRRDVYKIVVEIPGGEKKYTYVPAKFLHKLEAFLEKYGESESISWEDLAKDRIAKYTKSGLAIRGARYREGLSQKELAKRTGISQENISKMENGQRPIGEKVAKKLAKVLRIDPKLLFSHKKPNNPIRKK
ncbi:MAG TPA: helix-turn-helix transcriptional regulator [Rhabdochlamydiaceae bacterium]|jgi:DNA-binding XRE family transcriptional regulator